MYISFMEDEEYYHMMQDDLERLEHLHHHPEDLPPRRPLPNNISDNRRTTPTLSHPAADKVHNPWLSGLGLALRGALATGLETLRRSGGGGGKGGGAGGQ